jgi:hypothetical protein
MRDRTPLCLRFSRSSAFAKDYLDFVFGCNPTTLFDRTDEDLAGRVICSPRVAIGINTSVALVTAKYTSYSAMVYMQRAQ